MILEPLINKVHICHCYEQPRGTPVNSCFESDVKSAFNFYWTYQCNATRFCDEQPKHWEEWKKYLKENKFTSFTDWLLKYSFQDVVECQY